MFSYIPRATFCWDGVNFIAISLEVALELLQGKKESEK